MEEQDRYGKKRIWTEEEISAVITETVEQTTADLETIGAKVEIAVKLVFQLAGTFKGLFDSLQTRSLPDERQQKAFDLLKSYFEGEGMA